MLNFDVKRKINTLRDILVGKVPDPKAQVEQITIALIYKFMDDMDLEGMEFGGSREFFKEEYEKYAWTNIMQSVNSGQQRAILYAEGIEKMATNPYLAQLFRDIFRGAYLPYRDPETLNLFLKEVGEFQYDHSEELGNAFELLLSIMGSQGDAGQFRTPRHIIDMIVEIVDPKKTDSILDPACGTAGFLISSYKHILENNKDKEGHITLSADERRRLTENIAGYDISPDMVRLSRVNMYLHQFAKPKISEYDTLSSLDKWNESYDVILANPPFMTPKGGIVPHNRYRIKARRAEVLFVDYIAEHLNPMGKAGVVVPEGIVFQTANAYKELRKYLVEDDLLYAVISLPAGVFNPYSGVKTSILLMDKAIAKQKDEILFVKINNDGYELGAQRKEIKDSDIPEAIKVIKDYQSDKDVSDSSLVTIASKEELAKQDYILVGDRYKETIIVNSDWPMVELGEICELKRGTSITRRDIEEGDIPVIAGGQTPAYYHNTANRTGKVITVSGSGAYAGFINYFEKPIYASDCSTIQSTNPEVNITYVYHVIKTQQDKFYKLQSGMGQPHVYVKNIKPFKIPLPPINVQKEIIKEIEGYQKVLDGARHVVENYKPIIFVNPDWEMTKLGEVCDINKETILPEKVYGEEEFIYLDISAVENRTGKINYQNYVKGTEAPSRARRKIENESVLLSTVRPNLKAFAYVDFDDVDKVIASTGFATLKSETANNRFIYYSILQDYLLKQMVGAMGKGAYPSINQRDVNNLKIALPSRAEQDSIVNQLDDEMVIVEQNKKLIELFEDRIKEKISSVWGE